MDHSVTGSSWHRIIPLPDHPGSGIADLDHLRDRPSQLKQLKHKQQTKKKQYILTAGSPGPSQTAEAKTAIPKNPG